MRKTDRAARRALDPMWLEQTPEGRDVQRIQQAAKDLAESVAHLRKKTRSAAKEFPLAQPLASRIILDFQTYFRQLKKRTIDAIVAHCEETKRCDDSARAMKIREVARVKDAMDGVIQKFAKVVELLAMMDSVERRELAGDVLSDLEYQLLVYDQDGSGVKGSTYVRQGRDGTRGDYRAGAGSGTTIHERCSYIGSLLDVAAASLSAVQQAGSMRVITIADAMREHPDDADLQTLRRRIEVANHPRIGHVLRTMGTCDHIPRLRCLVVRTDQGDEDVAVILPQQRCMMARPEAYRPQVEQGS